MLVLPSDPDNPGLRDILLRGRGCIHCQPGRPVGQSCSEYAEDMAYVQLPKNVDLKNVCNFEGLHQN